MVFFDAFAPQAPQRSRPSFNAKDKQHLYASQKEKCNGCMEKFPLRNMTVDHIKPFSQGGSDKLSNLQLLCNSCNSIKGNGTQAQLKKRLVEKGIIKGSQAAAKAKTKTTARKPAKKKAAPARKRQPAKKRSHQAGCGLIDPVARRSWDNSRVGKTPMTAPAEFPPGLCFVVTIPTSLKSHEGGPRMSPVTSEQLQSTVWERLDAGVPKTTIVGEIGALQVLMPVDGQHAVFQMDQSAATTYVGQVHAMRRRQIRRGAILNIAVGIVLMAPAIGAIALANWPSTTWLSPYWLSATNWMDDNFVVASAGVMITVSMAFLGLISTIRGSFRLLMPDISVLIRSRNVAMKVVNKLNGSADIQ